MIPFVTYDPATGTILQSGMIDAASLAAHPGHVLEVAEHRPDYDSTHRVIDGDMVAYTPNELAERATPVGWATKRRNTYPPLADLADATYWAAQGDNSKMTEYLATVTAVKAQFPKATA